MRPAVGSLPARLPNSIVSTIILQDERRRAHALKVIGALDLDQLWSVTIEPYQPKRSSQANRRYWALLQRCSEKTGYETSELHEMLKAQFAPRRTLTIKGEECTVPASTASMKSKGFLDYMEKVERWGIQTLCVWLE